MSSVRRPLSVIVVWITAFFVVAPVLFVVSPVMRLLSRWRFFSDARRRMALSATLLHAGNLMFGIWRWGQGRVLLSLPKPTPGVPAIITANHRGPADYLVLSHVCLQLGLRDVRWVVRSRGVWDRRLTRWLGDLAAGARDQSSKSFGLRAFVTASLELDSGASFVLLPEALPYNPSRPNPEWIGLRPPRTSSFSGLCAALPRGNVVVLALMWNPSPSAETPVLGVMSEVHEGIPGQPAKWLKEAWRRVEATILSSVGS